MLQGESKHLDPETQKQISDAAKINDAGKIAQQLFQYLDATNQKQPDPQSDEMHWLTHFGEPSYLKFEEDDFDKVEIVSLIASRSSFLEETEFNSNLILKEIAFAAADNGFPDKALKIAQRIKKGWEQTAYEAVVYGYVKIGALDQAFEKCVLIDDEETRRNTLCGIAAKQFSEGQKEASMKTVNEAASRLKSENVYFWSKIFGRISTIRAKLGDFDSAIQIISAIEGDSERAIAWCHIATEQAKNNNHHESTEFFNKALQQAKEIKYHTNRFKVLLMISKAMAQTGDFVYAISTIGDLEWDTNRATVLDRIFSDGLPPSHFGCRVCAMQGYHEEFEIITTHDKALCDIAGIQAQAGDFTGALNTAKLIGWDPYRAKAFLSIGKCFANSGKLDSAREIFAKAFLICKESGSKNQSLFLSDIALEQAKVEDFELATITACSILEDSFRIETFGKIGEVCGQLKSWASAQWIFKEALETTEFNGDIKPRIEALINVAVGQANAQERQAAEKTLLTARDLAMTTNELYDKIRQLLRIAKVQTKTNECEALITFEMAIKLAQENKNLEQIRTIAVQLAESGFNQKAITVALEISTSYKEWPYVASVFIQRGDLVSFKQILIQGSYDAVTVGKVCILLAQAYPDQAETIADVVIRSIGKQITT